METTLTFFFVLASLPVGLILLRIFVVRNKVLIGHICGAGAVVLSPILCIFYIDRFLCVMPTSCELMGLWYIFLGIEAIILLLIYFALGSVVQKKAH